MVKRHSSSLIVLASLIPGIPTPVFWTYFAGILTFALGLITILREEWPTASGNERWLLWGRVMLAVPMAVFGTEHLLFAKGVAGGVPAWIPWHLFWAYLVGVALIAAALSIATKRLGGLAGLLLGSMILSFVLLIHVPKLLANPSDRLALTLVWRDLAFSAGAFAFFAMRTREERPWVARRMATAVRYVIGIAMVYLGAQHFFHPNLSPVVPLSLVMPVWMPLQSLCAYVVGLVLVGGGLALLANWRATTAAIWLGLVTMAALVLVYLPILAAKPTDIGTGVNNFADILTMSGALFLLASANGLTNGEPKTSPVTRAAMVGS